MTESAMNRRRVLAVLGTVGVAGVAGCLGEEGFEYVAEKAIIPDAESRGYEVDGPQELEINETIEAGGISQDVHIRTWSVSYASPENEASLFLFSTPDVSIAGVSVNPLARLSGADLIARVLNEGLGDAEAEEGIREIEAEDELELTVLGETREVAVFSAVFDAGDGELPTDAQDPDGSGEIPIKLYVLSFAHENDVILSVGLHPDMAEVAEEIGDDDLIDDADTEVDDTADEIIALMEAIDHPVE